MAVETNTNPHTANPEVARVDGLVDETGARIDVPDDSALKVATDLEQAVGATGPTNWWRLGLLAVAILAAVLFIMQYFAGGAGTDMIPGTPTVAPEAATPVQPMNP